MDDYEKKVLTSFGIYLLSTVLFVQGFIYKKDDEYCDATNSYHVHKVIRDYGGYTISKWAPCNDVPLGYTKTDSYIPTTKTDIDIYNNLNEHNLVSGLDNMEYINNEINNNRDYLEYYYYHHYTTISYDSNGHSTIKSHVSQGWTTDKNHSHLTGRVRVNHTRYCCYKLVYYDESNTFDIVPSDYVDDPRDLLDEYPFFGSKKTVYKEMEFSWKEIQTLTAEDVTPFYTPDKISNNELILKQD